MVRSRKRRDAPESAPSSTENVKKRPRIVQGEDGSEGERCEPQKWDGVKKRGRDDECAMPTQPVAKKKRGRPKKKKVTRASSSMDLRSAFGGTAGTLAPMSAEQIVSSLRGDCNVLNEAGGPLTRAHWRADAREETIELFSTFAEHREAPKVVLEYTPPLWRDRVYESPTCALVFWQTGQYEHFVYSYVLPRTGATARKCPVPLRFMFPGLLQECAVHRVESLVQLKQVLLLGERVRPCEGVSCVCGQWQSSLDPLHKNNGPKNTDYCVLFFLLVCEYASFDICNFLYTNNFFYSLCCSAVAMPGAFRCQISNALGWSILTEPYYGGACSVCTSMVYVFCIERTPHIHISLTMLLNHSQILMSKHGTFWQSLEKELFLV